MDIDLLKYWKPLDVVGPIEAALQLHSTRENEKTQRMFAQNQMQRQSAEDFRKKKEDEEKDAERTRQHGIDAAEALGRAQTMMRTPGGLGPAQALMEAYGGHLNPLTAAVAGPPPQGDQVDQALAAAPPAGPAAPPELGPAAPPPPAPDVAADRAGPGGLPLEGPQQMQHSVEGNFLLPTAFHVSPGMQGAMDHKGYVPPGSALMPETSSPGGEPGIPWGALPANIAQALRLGEQGHMPEGELKTYLATQGGGGVSDAELERLMRGATPPPAPAPAPAPSLPTNPLYEAVMGGHHYPMSTEMPKTGLSPKFEAVFRADMAMGANAQGAFGKAYAAQQAEEKGTAQETRMLDAIKARNDETDKNKAAYSMTAEQQQARDAMRDATSRRNTDVNAASRERVGGAGGGDVASEISNHLTAHPGDVEGASRIAEAHNIHGQKAAALVGGIATDLGKKPPTAWGVDKSKIVRDLDGTPRGIAPSGRGGAASLQSDLRTNGEALDKMIKLRRSGQTLAMGPEYHDGVLALSAVTTAGKTDTTTHHEEGSITNWTGKMISSEGLDNKINQIRTRMQEIRSQLAPLPEGYTEERAGASKGKKLSAGELAGGSFLP